MAYPMTVSTEGNAPIEDNRNTEIQFESLSVSSSNFLFSGSEWAFIAGISGLTRSSFSVGYNAFFYQDEIVIDAEKCNAISHDDQMCWAATAANMLYYTNWNWSSSATPVEDDFFSIFIDCFQKGEEFGGKAYYGIDWFITGDYDPMTWDEWDYPQENTGGYYDHIFSSRDYNIAIYLQKEDFSVNALREAKEKLEDGYAVGASFGYYDDKGERVGGHALTVWGMTYDTAFSVSNPNYYTGIIVSDSDDDKSKYSDPQAAPDTLKIISIEYDSSREQYILDPDYAGENRILEELCFLAPNPGFKPRASVTHDYAVKIYRNGSLTSQTNSAFGETLSKSGNDIMRVSNGGIANSTTVNSGGFMYISSGGMASNTRINARGEIHIYNGGIANSTTVNSSGFMYISSGGMASNTRINARGEIRIYNGGIANSTTVNSSGRMYISSGGVANSTTVNSGGWMYISSGGVVNSTTVNSGGDMFIWSGGVANSTTVNSGGWMYISSGGVANSTTVNSRGYMDISSGGVANSTTVNSGGSMYIARGGVANRTTVNSGGGMHIFSGGTATDIRVLSGGNLNIIVAPDTYIQGTSNGSAFEMKDAQISGYTISDGYMDISSGGTANSTTVNSGGWMYISSGGVANSTTLKGFIYSSGNTFHYVRGWMYISSGGVANSTTVNSGGWMTISSGGVANSTTVNFGGDMFISSGGVANSTTVSKGYMYISSGGVANSTTVNSGGSATLYTGAVLQGKNTLGGKIVMSGTATATGANLDFAVNQRKTTDGYIVNNLSRISGAPTYTITVSANQECGAYKLAQGAGNFRGAISVGDGSISYGNLSVNGTALKYNDLSYKLTLSGGNLHLSVDRAVVPVTDSPATDIKNRGFSQVVAWDKNRGTVGMIHNDGSSPAAWGGIWEWSGSDINLWRVAGAGHFKGSKVDYDGVLLYNGIGNTFAAWTDLNDPSYGYVDLCHVEGSFNTRAIADFDGNNYDDILIYDDKGSFGTVLDGTTYKDIWHVDNPVTNPWKVLGAGSFGGKEDKLIVENSSNGHLYLWQNNDSTFKTWNWSQIDIGYLGKDSKFMVSGDFNGDGTDDVVIQKSNGEMWCWDDGNSANLRWIGNLDSTFAVESVGDYNGDGKEDILLREQSSGWGGLGFWGAGYAGNWTDMNVRIETDTRISGSKFAIIA